MASLRFRVVWHWTEWRSGSFHLMFYGISLNESQPESFIFILNRLDFVMQPLSQLKALNPISQSRRWDSISSSFDAIKPRGKSFYGFVWPGANQVWHSNHTRPECMAFIQCAVEIFGRFELIYFINGEFHRFSWWKMSFNQNYWSLFTLGSTLKSFKAFDVGVH